MPKGKMKRRVPPPPPAEEPEPSQSEIERLVSKVLRYGDIWRLRRLTEKLLDVYLAGSVDRRSSHYVHQKTTDFSWDSSVDPRDWVHDDGQGTRLTPEEEEEINKLLSQTEETITKIIQDDINAKIYKELEKEWDWLNADEQVEEAIRANGYEFDEDGNRRKEGEYQYDQLPTPDAKDRARCWYRDGAFDYEWWDSVIDHWKEQLEKAGFESPDISFSGFYSQGDGASFTCKSFDFKSFAFALADAETREDLGISW